MESKNVKIIDEHNIDRNANVICAFNFNSADYVLYWIDRDEDNANLFVSKLLKNNDNTYNMLNIDDSMEKSRVSDIVKKVVSIAVKSEEDKANTSLTLDDGSNISLFNPSFNREQNINVTKTYVTTVKKSVAKVSRNYLDVKVDVTPASNNEPMFNDIFVDAPKPETVSEVPMPEAPAEPIDMPNPEPIQTNEDIMNSFVDNINTVPEAPAAPTAVEPTPVPAVEPIFALGGDTPIPAPMPEDPAVIPAAPNALPSEPALVNELPPVSPEPAVASVQLGESVNLGAPEAPKTEPTLVFDASSEVNLNNALNAGENNNVVVTNDDNSLRAFGQDALANAPADAENPTEPATGGNGGFAHFKAVAAIGLVVFMGACAFMGYEIFNYIQIVNK